ncbi:MBL fold metallo-hydrolase [Wielerella bovis]|uniref:MBL fold metallo-hydrolase n=1 Tax=Wielerella bovis TaxID=2917790 RepID=UPI0020184112|nr:MBL fold metallo-hydrolase [Wielerella bovis]MCG7657202.1 MBL fold metallo-hydrolase [Wielerella bovis]MCG7659425.1 MBL fold metallo-hydrolase [Wielerella bovis]
MKRTFFRKKRFWIPAVLLTCFAIYAAAVYVPFPKYPASDHYNPTTGEFFNTPPSRKPENGTIGALVRMMLQEKQYHPPRPLPMQKPDWEAFYAPSRTAKFIWFGHSTLLMRLNGKNILIDPVYDNTPSPIGLMMHRFQPPPVALEALPPIDLVVYSHAHYDHLDSQVVRYFAQNRPEIQYLTPLGLGAYLRKWGVQPEKIQERDWWQSVDYFGTQMIAVPARHDASRSAFDAKKSLWAGWVFQTPHEKIYFSGDSSYAPHFAELGKKLGGFDLAFVENGQYNTLWLDNHMLPEQTVQAVADVRAKRWMPIHWGAYPLSTHSWDEPVRESSRLAAAKQLPMLTPIIGQVFDKNTPTRNWWEEVK